MLVDLRYHLISLVGVFLALAVGIVVGSSFLAGSAVEGLKSEFGQLRDDNRKQQRLIYELTDRLNKHKEFERAVAPMLVNGRLSWQRVAIIQTGDYGEATQSARSALEAAGARVVSVTTFSNLAGSNARERAARAVELVTEESGSPDPVGAVLGIAAENIVTGSNPEAIAILEEKGLLSKAGEYNRRVQNIVVVGGSKRKSDKRPQRIDLVLLAKLQELGANVVPCEPFEVGTSYVPVWLRKNVSSTVDNIDDAIGQINLVFAVSGETGNFGMKESADRILPEYLEGGQWRSESRR